MLQAGPKSSGRSRGKESMKHEDVKIGMKVVPHSKSVGMSFKEFLGKFGGFDYLLVDDSEEGYWVLRNLSEESWNFIASDFEPYIEPEQSTTPEIKVDWTFVPEMFNWIAMDSDGELNAFCKEPDLAEYFWSFSSEETFGANIGNAPAHWPRDKWREMKFKRPE